MCKSGAVKILADLQFQQVLDNLARFHDNPDVVPSFAVASAGTVSVLDTAGVGVSPPYSPSVTFPQQIGSGLPISRCSSPSAPSGR